MKYIRTKDAYGKEIIALFDDRPIEKGGNVLKFSQKSIVLRQGIATKVIKRKDFDNAKQSDTIEELCDEFVVILANGRINQFKTNTMANEVQTTNDFVKQAHIRFCKENPNYEKVFGAIWTDKGLIYVAKMNEKGVLELL